MDKILKCRLIKGIATAKLEAAVGISVETEKAGEELNSFILKRFGRSLNIREVDTGSCGGCESEIISATNPIYDIQRFGINFVASPRHADALLATGPVSKNMRLALEKVYLAMPEPKFVISLGDCSSDGGIFKGSYYVEGGAGSVLPVTLHIPGCPPSPLRIIKALLDFLKK